MSLSPVDLQNAIRSEALSRPDFSPQSAEAILRYGAFVGSTIRHFQSTNRLMAYAREHISEHENKEIAYPSGYVYSADQLVSSKGRFLRSWHAPEGGVWITLVLVNTLLAQNSSLLPIAAGVACCEAVRHFGIDASVKWVNDVHVGGRKIAGILTETYTGPVHGEEFILIGIGLNVNNCEFPKELLSSAASMSMYTEFDLDLEAVRLQLLAKLAWNIGLLHFEEDTRLRAGEMDCDNSCVHPLISAWKRVSDTLGQRVSYGFNVIEKVQYVAKVVDIDNKGRLLMKLPDGSTVTENSGEILYSRK